MTHTDNTLYAQVAEALLDAAKTDYADVADTWNRIESKAQGTIAVAGIFLAAVFALARDSTVLGKPYMPVILTCAVGALAASVILALFALRVRQVPTPPTDALAEIINDLARIKDTAELAERIPGFYGDQAGVWRNVTQQLAALNLNKANYLWLAQLLLVFAVLIVAGGTVYRLIP